MKKTTAILFLFISLFNITGFHELLKINVLAEHFYETQKNERSLSFYQFLVMHYITDDLNDEDNERDKQLPFKSIESCIANSTLMYISCQDTPSLTGRPFAMNGKNFLIAKDVFVLPNYHILVWHPPKYS